MVHIFQCVHNHNPVKNGLKGRCKNSLKIQEIFITDTLNPILLYFEIFPKNFFSLNLLLMSTSGHLI